MPPNPVQASGRKKAAGVGAEKNCKVVGSILAFAALSKDFR